MLRHIVPLLLLATVSMQTQAGLSNTLANHPSPYLAMHGNDPVHWQTWNRETFNAARAQNKLLFVSSGYFSCHWCHVMQRESYQNPEIARFINQHFIPVKVDRELNPALDAYLISFLENTQGYSGWPLNVFITPQGHPLVGLVYQPPEQFRELLGKLDSLWKSDAKSLSEDAKNAAAELELQNTRPKKHQASAHDITSYQQSLLAQTWQLADELQGGFGEQSKFPMAPQLKALLRLYEQNRDPRLEKFLRLTLDQMSSQGLYDQLGGGFFRYTTDPDWQIPHFEKMLYDNALLASAYFDAARILKQDKYQRIALDTIDFILRDMQHKDGSFIASLSAIDNKNIEGGYYLWQKNELQDYLSKEEYRIIGLHWGISGTPTLDDGYHAVQRISLAGTAKQLKLTEQHTQKLYQSAMKKLLSIRSTRALPKDDKRLASWNALTLSALIQALSVSREPRYQQAAEQTYQFLVRSLWDGTDLYRARSGNTRLGKATLEDYSLLTQALIDWHGHSKDESAMRLAYRLNLDAWARFYRDGWQRSEETFLQYGNRNYLISDDVLPSPSATLLQNSLFLAKHFEDRSLLEKTREAIDYSHQTLLNEPFWYVGYISVARSRVTQ